VSKTFRLSWQLHQLHTPADGFSTMHHRKQGTIDQWLGYITHGYSFVPNYMRISHKIMRHSRTTETINQMKMETKFISGECGDLRPFREWNFTGVHFEGNLPTVLGWTQILVRIDRRKSFCAFKIQRKHCVFSTVMCKLKIEKTWALVSSYIRLLARNWEGQGTT
jgi:hypothetical protein